MTREIIKDEEGLLGRPLGTILRDSCGSVYVLDLDSFQNRQWYECGRDYADPMDFPVLVVLQPKDGDEFV